ncbi:MAG TPA: hypothetical protein ENF70_00310 [Deltaproteobacteria bacterium]|nr:hypothetical protein [Deltaproteobacteria bacterium]
MKIRLLPQERKILEDMGLVLRDARLACGEPRDVFGGRIGVSRQFASNFRNKSRAKGRQVLVGNASFELWEPVAS